jgi:hypothetical protein
MHVSNARGAFINISLNSNHFDNDQVAAGNYAFFDGISNRLCHYKVYQGLLKLWHITKICSKILLG